jgi:hypothetical protein
MTKLNRDYDAVITKYKVRIAELENQIKSERATFDKEVNKNKEKREKDKENYRDEVRELEEVIRGLKRTIANGMYNPHAPGAAAADDDVDDIASTNLSVNLNSVDQSTENESSDDSSDDSEEESVVDDEVPEEDPNEELLNIIGSNQEDGILAARKREMKLKVCRKLLPTHSLTYLLTYLLTYSLTHSLTHRSKPRKSVKNVRN